MIENCCENYTDDPKDNNLIDEIANTLPTDTKFIKNRSAMEKCLDLARNSNAGSMDDAIFTDLFVSELDPEPGPTVPEGVVLTDVPEMTQRSPVDDLDNDAQPSSVDFGMLDLETAGLRRSGRQRKPTWKLADPINNKLKTALGLLSFVVL